MINVVPRLKVILSTIRAVFGSLRRRRLSFLIPLVLALLVLALIFCFLTGLSSLGPFIYPLF